MIDKMKKDEDIDVYDEGTPIRDVMHVKDVCRALRLVMDKETLMKSIILAVDNRLVLVI